MTKTNWRARVTFAAEIAICLVVAIGVPLLMRAWFLGEQMKTLTWQLHKSTFVADALFVMFTTPNLIILAYQIRQRGRK